MNNILTRGPSFVQFYGFHRHRKKIWIASGKLFLKTLNYLFLPLLFSMQVQAYNPDCDDLIMSNWLAFMCPYENVKRDGPYNSDR